MGQNKLNQLYFPINSCIGLLFSKGTSPYPPGIFELHALYVVCFKAIDKCKLEQHNIMIQETLKS